MVKKIDTKKYSCRLDEGFNFKEITDGGKSFKFPVDCTYFEIDGKGVSLRAESDAENEVSYKPMEMPYERASSLLSQEKIPRFSPKLRIAAAVSPDNPGEIKIEASPKYAKGEGEKGNADEYAYEEITEKSRAGMTLFFPDTVKIHLAEHKNIGRLLDSDMKLETEYSCKLEYNMMIIETGNMALRFRTDTEGLKNAGVKVRRHDETFAVTFYWDCKGYMLLGFFDSFDEAVEDFKSWVSDVRGIRKLKDRDDVPKWIHDIKAVMFIDMMLSNWKVQHDYYDVIDMAKDIKKCIDPKKVLFYLPGWQGAYDGYQPAYKPDEKLGGEQGFRDMTDALRQMGFRTMIHSCIWGIDPYDGNAEEWEKHSVKRDGKLKAWQISDENPFRMTKFNYRSKKIPLGEYNGQKSFDVSLGYLPGDCYAYLTVGGVKNFGGKIKLSSSQWTIASPTDWYKKNELHDFTYPLYYPCGNAVVKVEPEGEADLKDAWIEIRNTNTYTNPYISWTYPMLWAKPDDNYFADIMAKNLKEIVDNYKVDALHMDAGTLKDETLIVKTVKETLPKNIIFGCEWYTTWEEVDFWMLAQKAVTDLVTESYPQNIVQEQASPPMLEKTYEYFAWMDKPSPICDFIKEYICFYQHLVAANSFVPTNKISNITPERKIPHSDDELWRVTRNAHKLGYFAGLRLNYKKYGLDKNTKKALKEIEKW